MKKKLLFWFIPGVIVGILLIFGSEKLIKVTGTDEFCMSCHIHPQADMSWRQSVHYDNRTGVKVHCIECHLPPHGEGYLKEKAITGIRDVYGKFFKDSASFDWEAKSQLEHAVNHTYNSSCIKCHQSLFPTTLSQEGEDAHLYYEEKHEEEDLHCINCHLNAGHYDPNYTHAKNVDFGKSASENTEIYENATEVNAFENYYEKIPNSRVGFNMIAIPGGVFEMGSPDDEKHRKDNESTPKEVKLKSFFMAEIEVSWDEYLAFYAQTSGEGRSTDTEGLRKGEGVDGIVGATPPYGQPDQNWGLGARPAISMSYHAAETYCKWLSMVTGKTYRLPTEAEWEYACRANTQSPYFFEGDPGKFLKTGLSAVFSKNDTTNINSYVVYFENSRSKTQEPSFVSPNPYGLKNMLGNVAEFCSDWYTEDPLKAYTQTPIVNPQGPDSGREHVIRGGSFKSMADGVRCASRDSTQTSAWLRTDPQIPKSVWWFSDCFYVGFRVVCEFDEKTGNLEKN